MGRHIKNPPLPLNGEVNIAKEMVEEFVTQYPIFKVIENELLERELATIYVVREGLSGNNLKNSKASGYNRLFLERIYRDHPEKEALRKYLMDSHEFWRLHYAVGS